MSFFPGRIGRDRSLAPDADAAAQLHDRSLDWMMLACVALCCLGLIMAVSVQGSAALNGSGQGALMAMKAQGSKLAVGLVAFLVCAMAPMSWVIRFAQLGFFITTGLCLVAAFMGAEVNHAHRWINFAHMQFQPVDLARVFTVLYCALLMAQAGPNIREFKKGILYTMWPAVVLAAALMLQPDNGNAFFVLGLVACMGIAAGVRFFYFAALGIPVLAAAVALAATKGYVRQRLVGFLEPEIGGQVWQSKVAIASGGWFGQGLGNGWMKMGFVPEASNDFIFAVIGEELGFIGSILVLFFYCTIGYMGLRLVLNCEDRFMRLVVFGLTLAICMQAAINLLVVTGLAPAKGIDLPLLSSGGTNLVVCLASVGLIGNAARVDARWYKGG